MKHDILRRLTRPEDQLLVSKAFDSAFLCLKTLNPVFTDFYDPKSAKLVTDSVKKLSEVSAVVSAFGGTVGTERAMLCFSPEDLDISNIEFPIKALFIDSSKFSSSLTHRDFLGAIVGLGIDRCKIGDIFVDDGNATVFVHEGITDFIIFELTKVGRIGVRVSEHNGEIDIFTKEGKMIKTTVPSLRADAIAGEAFALSRAKAATLIKSEKLFVNWSIMPDVSKQLKEGDVISARGLGRAIIRTVGGRTKKDRLFVEIETWR